MSTSRSPSASSSRSNQQQHHRRSSSSASSSAGRPRSPETLPSQTHHTSILPTVPTPALVESVAGGAHYSGSGRVQSPDELFVSSPPGSPLPSAGGGELSPTTSSSGIRKRRRSSQGDSSVAGVHRPLSGSLTRHTLAGPLDEDEHEEEHEDEGRKRLLSDLKELYEGRPTAEIFERGWRKDATFEDPLCKAKGYHEYAAQWYALRKVLSSSKTMQSRIMSSTKTPNRLVISQTQEYVCSKWLGRKKMAIESIVILDLDEEDKIVRMIDQWDGKELPERFGAGLLRRMNGRVLVWFVGVPKR